MQTPFERRIAACQRRLAETGADLAVCFPGPNLTYLTGFEESPSERHLLLFVPERGDPALVAPAMYAEQLSALPIAALQLRLWDDADDPLEHVVDVLEEYSVGGSEPATVLVDDRMWATFTQDLRDLLPDAEFDLASAVLEGLRLRKDEVEREALRRAGEIADRVSLEVRARGTDLVGTTESELASEIDRLLAAAGGEEPAFDTIVAAGPNSARPHHHSGAREIAAGDPIVLDFGAFVPADLEAGTSRYPGDQTRTIVVGEPAAEYARIHEIVREAQRAAIDAVEPGATAGSIDHAARSVVAEAGYGDAFVHRTGHGVGLEVHEPPYIVEGNDRELEPGMVFSVEPGIYFEGEFGVRIEDLVVVTEDGATRLNETPRGWETDLERDDGVNDPTQ
ncbi:M24 family metallopeptidase [Natrinema longum]|uniref:Aminopeptidase P family protein n=1 Tax=Natrinema longum TaxID=370324 RepID=A0A8A2U7M7_9EURY|nr:Xaa-Pro peptidase family protein [Natrinema longum]MBZ6494028.1 Xaa-Pro peptidase family protein [Natrinema longum]QSW84637.1 aminopeptidase P family protein [Natrinema longum]